VNGRNARSAERARVHFWAGQPTGIDMIMQSSVGAPFPTRAGSRSSTSPGLQCGPPAGSDLARVAVAGLAELPTYGAALAAVPDVGARPSTTSPSLPGTCATGCGPAAPARGREQRQFENYISHESHDRQNRDICCKCAAHVTIPLILNICVAARGDGITASRVAPGRNGLVPNRRAPRSGTAARVTALFGSIPSRPRPHVRGRREPGRHTRQPDPSATRSGPSRGRRANETGSARDRVPQCAESGSAHSRSRSHPPCTNRSCGCLR
jgi:hypothetical protein